MKAYRDLVDDILVNGTDRDDRTGTGTRSVFGRQLRFDLRNDGFPLVTIKRTNFRPIVAELLWFISGSTNIHNLDASIWDEWAAEDGDLGPIYGAQWRDFNGYDQLSRLIDDLRSKPHSRRHIVSAWNVADLPFNSLSPQANARIGKMALAPCHTMFQFYVADGRLSCHLYQRSGDVFLGVPFNIASYALLTHLVAAQVGLEVGDFVHSFGDVHIYHNHFDQVMEMVTRHPRVPPSLRIEPDVPSLFDYRPEHIELVGYDPHPAIKAPIAI